MTLALIPSWGTSNHSDYKQQISAYKTLSIQQEIISIISIICRLYGLYMCNQKPTQYMYDHIGNMYVFSVSDIILLATLAIFYNSFSDESHPVSCYIIIRLDNISQLATGT
jgi:hypothetical protein